MGYIEENTYPHISQTDDSEHKQSSSFSAQINFNILHRRKWFIQTSIKVKTKINLSSNKTLRNKKFNQSNVAIFFSIKNIVGA